MQVIFEELSIGTDHRLQFIDIGAAIQQAVHKSGVRQGMVSVQGLHTTTAITINENESRLMQDIEKFVERIAPSDAHYLHNDIHLRDCPPDEPENAHAHLLAMMFGNSESLAVTNGKIVLGKWQSIFLVELDGPRRRSVAVQILGSQ